MSDLRYTPGSLSVGTSGPAAAGLFATFIDSATITIGALERYWYDGADMPSINRTVTGIFPVTDDDGVQLNFYSAVVGNMQMGSLYFTIVKLA